MTKFELFKEFKSTYLGDRVSKRVLNNIYHDKEFVDNMITKLFVECPTKFPGEIKTEKHYLLKPFWQLYGDMLEIIEICGDKENKDKWRYIKQIISDNLFLWSDWRWYMHPTIISRHGRFFLTPKINF